MNLTPAAVDNVATTTPVSTTTQTLTLESGSRCHHCVLQKDVAARVSDEENIIFLIHFLCKTGNITSPNYPNNYPDNFGRTEKIRVEEGLVVAIEFTAFDVESHSTCDYDHMTIKNGNGTTLMEKTCGSSLPANVTSNSNIIEIYFHTDGSSSKPGWSLTWRAVTPGAQVSLFTQNCPQKRQKKQIRQKKTKKNKKQKRQKK